MFLPKTLLTSVTLEWFLICMYQHVRLQMPVDKQKQRLGVSIYEKFRQITYLWLMLEYGHKSHLKHFSPSWVFLWTFKVYLSGNDFPHILQCRALSDVCNFCMCNLKSVLRPHVVGHWKRKSKKLVNFCQIWFHEIFVYYLPIHIEKLACPQCESNDELSSC